MVGITWCCGWSWQSLAFIFTKQQQWKVCWYLGHLYKCSHFTIIYLFLIVYCMKFLKGLFEKLTYSPLEVVFMLRELLFFTVREGRLFVGRTRIFWGGLRGGTSFFPLGQRGGPEFFRGPRGGTRIFFQDVRTRISFAPLAQLIIIIY